MLKHPRAPAAGPGPSLVLLLLFSLVLSGVLAYQAQDAARSHRAASESALRDYAALAAHEFAREFEDELEDLADGTLDARFEAERRRSSDARLEEFAEEVREEVGPCECPTLMHDFFSLDLADGTLDMREATLPPALRSWIADTVRAHLEMGDLDGLANVALPRSTGNSLLFAVIRDDDGDSERAYGFVLERSRFAAATTRAILAEVPLLPPSLTREAADEEMLSITVRSDDRRLFHSGGAADAATRASDTLQTPLGSYLLDIAVRPEMADRLVIGGLPRSRLPLLLGIFLLTLGLSAIALVQLRRQQALVRLRSGFVASVSHELRTPLAQIRLFSDLLDSGRLDSDQRDRAVRIIGEEAQRLSYLVENVLHFSRSAQRLEKMSMERTDLAPLVREIVDAFAPLAHARDARIAAMLEPGSVAQLDRDALRQILLNLLDNAVKYGPRGQTIGVGVAREGARLRLWVDDQGPGVPPADRAAVWEPYHRLRRQTEAATGGSGIGLSVVRDLVASHGGTVAVEGAPGGGARFVAWFAADPSTSLATAERPVESGAPA